LKGILRPRPPSSMLGRQKSDVWLRGSNIETGGGREGGKMYHRMVYCNRMHVKTRLSQFVLSKIKSLSKTTDGTGAVISHNLKGIAPPVSPCSSKLGRRKSDVCLRDAYIEKGGGGGDVYHGMVYYNRMHVKTRLSQSILSKIVDR
jgi:hypothetical protein